MVFGFSFKTEKGENERELEGSILFSCSPVISSWTATSIKLHRGFGLALRRGCSAVDLVVFFGARFYDSTSGIFIIYIYFSLNAFNTLYVRPKALAFYLFQSIFTAC